MFYDLDLLDGLAGLAPDLFAELVRVEFPTDDHPVVLVLVLNLLDAVILCYTQTRLVNCMNPLMINLT